MGATPRAAFAGSSLYSAAKAAANMFVQYAASEGASQSTRVNAVAPGIVSTNIMGGAMSSEAIEGFAAGAQLVGRAGQSTEIANVVTLLASEDGSFMTGTIVTADGGWSLKA